MSEWAYVPSQCLGFWCWETVGFIDLIGFRCFEKVPYVIYSIIMIVIHKVTH